MANTSPGPIDPLDDDFERALRSAEPITQLRALALRLSSQGYDRDALTAVFEDARQRLRADDRESDEDAVVDVMDFIVGWCSPRMKLPVHGESG
jgi:hypothetical protein